MAAVRRRTSAAGRQQEDCRGGEGRWAWCAGRAWRGRWCGRRKSRCSAAASVSVSSGWAGEVRAGGEGSTASHTAARSAHVAPGRASDANLAPTRDPPYRCHHLAHPRLANDRLSVTCHARLRSLFLDATQPHNGIAAIHSPAVAFVLASISSRRLSPGTAYLGCGVNGTVSCQARGCTSASTGTAALPRICLHTIPCFVRKRHDLEHRPDRC